MGDSEQDNTAKKEGKLIRKLINKDDAMGSERLLHPETGEVYGEIIHCGGSGEKVEWDYDKKEGDTWRYRGTFDKFSEAMDAAEEDYMREQ